MKLLNVRTNSNSCRIGILAMLLSIYGCKDPDIAPVPGAVSEDQPLPGQIIVHPATSAWLAFENGDPHFLAGAGDPEDFLYRGILNDDGTRSGDQQEIIDKLRGTGVNGIYFQAVRSHGGDGADDHNPFIGHDPERGLNFAVLDQWDDWFEQLDDAGVIIYFFFYDDDASIWDTGSDVSVAERAFFEALVNRFERHENIVWIIAEEYQEELSAQRVSKLAAIVRAADNYDHVIGVHKLSGLSFDEFSQDPNIDQFTIQYNKPTAEELHTGMVQAWRNAAGRYNLNMSEARNHGTGPDARKKHWASAMGGAYVMVLGMDIATTDHQDLLDLGHLRTFMEATNFWEMAPNDDLAHAGTEYVLAKPGMAYILYASDLAVGAALGIRDLQAGEYRVHWFDPVTGDSVFQTVRFDDGNQSLPAPTDWSGEIAAFVRRVGQTGNIPPEAISMEVDVNRDEPVPIELTYRDTDGPGPYEFRITQPPSSGTLSSNGDLFTYAPNAGFAGTDQLTYVVDDGADVSSPATVRIEVGSADVNEAPRIEDSSIRIQEGSSHTLSLSFEDPDGPGPYAFEIVDPPRYGKLTGQGNDITYTPNPAFAGTDRFLWRVSDSIDTSQSAEVRIHVGSKR